MWTTIVRERRTGTSLPFRWTASAPQTILGEIPGVHGAFGGFGGDESHMVKSSKVTFARVAGLSVALFSINLGLSGCDLVERFAKKKVEEKVNEKHGAIAFDEDTGGWGYSHDHKSEEAAKKAATKECSTCKVHLTWEKGCAALAQSQKDKNVMSAKKGGTRKAAEGAAEASCLAAGAGPCKVVVWACNGK